MLIPAHDFIAMTEPYGFTPRSFKRAIAEITDKINPIFLTKSHPRKVYFYFDHKTQGVGWSTGQESDLPDTYDQTFTDAFKLLSVIAD